MSLTPLDELHDALVASATVSTLVDAQIYKFKRAHEMELLLRDAPYKSLISCEVADWAGPAQTATDPVFIVCIYSRNGDDGGAAYCAEIADAVKTALASGWTGVAVESMAGRVSWNQETISHQFKMEIRGHIGTSYTLSLATSGTSPEEYGGEVVFVASCEPSQAVQYRFMLSGPGTGSVWRDMTGWQGRNSFSWRPGEKDVGTSSIKVQIRAGPQSGGQVDQESASTSFEITEPAGGSSGSGTPPTITSLTPNLASPQEEGTQIDCICIAADADAYEAILYQFYLTGPGTASKKKIVQTWSKRNSWAWTPGSLDVGANTIEVQIRDANNAGEGSYDDSETISYTVTAEGTGSNSAPTITSLTPNLASPQVEATHIDCICIAADADTDRLYYRFFLTGPGTASKKKLVQDWGRKNSWEWVPGPVDVGASTIEVQIRDGLHAEEGSYDDSETISFTVTAAPGGGSNSAPTITSLTPNLASSQVEGTEIVWVCIAADADSDAILYRFFLTGPGTASKKRLVQDWSHKNSWEWLTETVDVGASTIEVQVRDGNHAGEGSYDAYTTASFTVTANPAGSGNTAPTITSLTPSLSSPRGQGTAIDFICIAADADNDEILYRFYLTGPGTASKKKMVQDWSAKNSWSWTPDSEDIGSNTIEVQVRDGNHAGEGSYDASTTASFTISSNTAPAIATNGVYINEAASTAYIGDTVYAVCDASDTDGDRILYRWLIYRDTIGGAMEEVSGWSTQNWIKYTFAKTDLGTLVFHCQVRDGKHAGEESYDDTDNVGVNVYRAEITSVTPSLASPQANENTIVFTCTPNKTRGIKYRFWQKGPGTGNVWRDMTGWAEKNSWSWRTLACDIGTNYVRCQVTDSEDSWDDADTTDRQTDTTYTIS